MTRLSTVHSLVHFDNLRSSSVQHCQRNTGNKYFTGECSVPADCGCWRRMCISVREQLKPCMTVNKWGECSSSSLTVFKVPDLADRYLPVLGAAAALSSHITYFVVIFLSARPRRLLPLPSAALIDLLFLSELSGKAQADLVGSQAPNGEKCRRTVWVSRSWSWSAKSPEEGVGGGGAGGNFVSSSSSHLAPLWAGGEKIPNKGNTSAPSSRPCWAVLCWAGPY